MSTAREGLARALGMAGEIVGPVRFAGETVDAVVTIDRDEAARRATASVAPVVDRELLDVLASLPLGEPVCWTDIAPWQHAMLDVCPAGLVSVDTDGVTRVWRPAVHVSGVIVHGDAWDPAITAASWFWCDAPRAAMLSADPAPRAAAVAVARHHGVGLAVDDANALHVLVPPAPTVPVPGPRHWRFLETCYAAWDAGQVSANARQART